MDAISGLTPDTSTSATTSTGSADQSLGQEAFLQLLVAQLRYQDPLSPTDSAEFMSQTAQFTSVEKLEEIAASMAEQSKNNEIATIGNLVGKTVSHADSEGLIVEQRVTAGRVDENGIILVLPDREIRISDVVSIIAPETAEATS
jgi:flagellar basal-body rod modification protein FlgD